jgi:HK97 family phage major capsid protein
MTVRKITTSLPVTDEQLADVPAAEAYLNNRLSYDVRRRLDSQLLEGDGVAPNLKGTSNIGGSLNSQALGSDPRPDAVYKAFDLIRTNGFAEPSVLFINPTDWQPIRLLRTADDIYIWGSPAIAGPATIWGVPVVQTTGVTANTAITGDYIGFSALYIRQGLDISMGYVNDDFTKGKKTIRADIRCAMVHFRTAAFAKITGL